MKKQLTALEKVRHLSLCLATAHIDVVLRNNQILFIAKYAPTGQKHLSWQKAISFYRKGLKSRFVRENIDGNVYLAQHWLGYKEGRTLMQLHLAPHEKLLLISSKKELKALAKQACEEREAIHKANR